MTYLSEAFKKIIFFAFLEKKLITSFTADKASKAIWHNIAAIFFPHAKGFCKTQ